MIYRVFSSINVNGSEVAAPYPAEFRHAVAIGSKTAPSDAGDPSAHIGRNPNAGSRRAVGSQDAKGANIISYVNRFKWSSR